MIHYSLVCAQGHEFESWFRDSGAFEAQAAQGLVVCPFCQTEKVSRAVMAPNVARRKGAPAPRPEGAALMDERHAELRAMIRQLREKIIEAAEDVGGDFPDEARKIEDGEAEPRAIRGRATLEEAKALIEEGIEILPMPGPQSEGS